MKHRRSAALLVIIVVAFLAVIATAVYSPRSLNSTTSSALTVSTASSALLVSTTSSFPPASSTSVTSTNATSVTSTSTARLTNTTYSPQQGIGYPVPALVTVGPDGQTVTLSVGSVQSGGYVQTVPLNITMSHFAPNSAYFLGITQGSLPNLDELEYVPLSPSTQGFQTNQSGDAVVDFSHFPIQNVFGYATYFGVWPTSNTLNYSAIIADAEYTWNATPGAVVTMTVYGYNAATGQLNATIAVTGFQADANRDVAFQFDDGDGGTFAVNGSGSGSWHSNWVFDTEFCPGLHWVDVSGPYGGWAAVPYTLPDN